MGERGRSSTKPIAGTYFHILLALTDKPHYGLGIVEEVAKRTDNEVQLGPGTLYTAIKNLLSDGLIDEVPTDSTSGADPRRRYYQITDQGRSGLAQEAMRLEMLVVAARAKNVLPTR